ncbi:hypothetical protein ERJ75_000162100 [Trypanosoma vivax]|nr:hypothetical protein ERJ75_000162100 [Trypanosoma vivax]
MGEERAFVRTLGTVACACSELLAPRHVALSWIRRCPKSAFPSKHPFALPRPSSSTGRTGLVLADTGCRMLWQRQVAHLPPEHQSPWKHLKALRKLHGGGNQSGTIIVGWPHNHSWELGRSSRQGPATVLSRARKKARPAPDDRGWHTILNTRKLERSCAALLFTRQSYTTKNGDATSGVRAPPSLPGPRLCLGDASASYFAHPFSQSHCSPPLQLGLQNGGSACSLRSSLPHANCHTRHSATRLSFHVKVVPNSNSKPRYQNGLDCSDATLQCL